MLNESLIMCYKNREVKARLALIAGDAILPVETVNEYAARVGYSPRHVRLMCDMGQLPATKVNGCWYIFETPPAKVATGNG